MKIVNSWLAVTAALWLHAANADEAMLTLPVDPTSISTFSSDVNPQPAPKDPVAAARSAYYFMDYTVARRAWEPLAEAGHADAQYGLFQIYSLGQHVTPDLALAMRWLRPAASQGHPAAAFSLGLAYLRGEGIERDLVQAWFWFSRAERKGFATAHRARTSVERKMTAAELAHAQQRLANTY